MAGYRRTESSSFSIEKKAAADHLLDLIGVYGGMGMARTYAEQIVNRRMGEMSPNTKAVVESNRKGCYVLAEIILQDD
jgi:hypothetical protein